MAIRKRTGIREFARRILPGGIRRGLRSYIADKSDDGYVRDMLSIVVPCYNVEKYVDECLRSILNQTYSLLEVIVVVDGATDGTEDIVRLHARADRRVRVIRQSNRGLSGARNTGWRKARGEFLWFIDSDDRISRDAATLMVQSLQRSGSDFAVANYRRFNRRTHWRAGPWIQSAHRERRISIAPGDFPEILVNAVAWSKVYRRNFWDSMGTEFPEGKLYEDQPVSAKAYAMARAVDILPEVLIDWRDRTDATSITQQTASVIDLQARMDAAQASLNVLVKSGGPSLAEERRIQLLSNDIQHSARHIPYASAEFWDALHDGVVMRLFTVEGVESAGASVAV